MNHRLISYLISRAPVNSRGEMGRRGLLAFVIAAILACTLSADALASVILRHFSATIQADRTVLVRWETASEKVFEKVSHGLSDAASVGS